MKKIITTNRQGSSLLVAILVMGILMTLTLGLSALVIREINQTGDAVSAGIAYYSAEAGVENALLDLHEHLPGFQTKGLPQAVEVNGEKEWIEQKDVEPHYEYNIRNKGNAYPYFDPDEPIYLEPGVGVTKKFIYDGSNVDALEATYNVLPLSDTITIPLFSDCGDGTYEDVKDFVLQYYVKFEADESVKLAAKKLEDFDILRWKVFGTPSDGDATIATRTHAISDFFPAVTNNSAQTPVCIGSNPDPDLTSGCIFPVAAYVKKDSTIEAFTDVWSQARQCFVGDAGGMVTAGQDIKTGCTIANFMGSHKKNYLTITNIVNPDIVGISNPLLRDKRANIYYRILAKRDPASTACDSGTVNDEDVMPREFAHIRSDGFSSDGKVKQSIDVNLKLNNFLPVFNFTLYHTDPNKAPEVTTPLLPGFPFTPTTI